MKFKGKNIIITGSNQGFGKFLAEEFIKDSANVIICARNFKLLKETQKEISKYLSEDQKLYALKLDINNYNSLNNFYAYSKSLFNNKIDILVNNAGIQGAKGLIEDVNFDEWIETININLIGTVNLTRLILPSMKKQKHGKIINLSGGGSANPRTHFSAYATSKAAIVRFSECIAEELRPYNIDVNCVAPGAMNTRLLDENIEAGISKVGEEYYNKALKQKESGGESMNNASELIKFLASDESSGITGKLISAVWDDWKELSNHKQELNNTDIYTLRRIIPTDRCYYWMEKK